MRQSNPNDNVIPFPRSPCRRRPTFNIVPLVGAIFAGLLLGFALWYGAPDGPLSSAYAKPATPPIEQSEGRAFTFCDGGSRINCVIDGDTFRLDGRKIRIADIDAPEIHPPRCPREELLGQTAKVRLLELLNAGPFELRTAARGFDSYSRRLRFVYRGGTSIGEVLVREGLARTWDGQRHPWCD